MVIRGASSLTSDNQPLFVVDGIPMNNTLNNITEMARDTKVDYGNAFLTLTQKILKVYLFLKDQVLLHFMVRELVTVLYLLQQNQVKKVKVLGVTITSNTVIENPYKYLEKHTMMANGQRPFTQDNRPNNGLHYYSVPAGDSYWVGPEMDKGMMAYQWPYFNAEGELLLRPLVSHPDNYKNFFETGYTTDKWFINY